MTASNDDTQTDRRADVRLASGKTVDVVIRDRHDQPVTLIRDSEVVNVSAGGVALIARSGVDVGAYLELDFSADPSAQRGGGEPLVFKAVDSVAIGGQKHRIRCQLAQGHVPAKLLYGW